MADDDAPAEEWRDIEGCWPYQVSNHGRVKRLACIGIKGVFGREGHNYNEMFIVPTDAEINLYKDGKSKWFSLGALVLRAFVGPPPEGCRLARHLDDDRSNNHLSNLAWGTDRDNALDSVRNGTFRNFAGRTHSEETKAKMRANNKIVNSGKSLSDEHRQRIGEALKGIPRSDEVKEKISIAHAGIPMNFSDEHRRYLAEQCSLRFKGKPKSEETRAKMRAASLVREANKRLAKGVTIDER